MAKVEVELKKLHKILVDSDYSYQVPDYLCYNIYRYYKPIKSYKEL
ncbi:hypothetical protein HpHA245_16160 [Helicobacter pylori]